MDSFCFVNINSSCILLVHGDITLYGNHNRGMVARIHGLDDSWLQSSLTIESAVNLSLYHLSIHGAIVDASMGTPSRRLDGMSVVGNMRGLVWRGDCAAVQEVSLLYGGDWSNGECVLAKAV